jgi:hypothetical protein
VIQIEYKGALIRCNDAREAQDILRFIASENDRERGSYAARQKSPWDAQLFWKFVESLGQPQRQVLKLLLEHGTVEAELLRDALSMKSNQQLAGVLSGISKQAAAIGIPARAVFKIENESSSGEITKSYVVAQDFVAIAKESNWADNE